MKYSRLSKEQFESLHQEFINFLATQQITAAEWDTLKTTQPEVVEQELDVFSDLIWEGVLKNVGFIEHFSPQQIHLFNSVFIFALPYSVDLGLLLYPSHSSNCRFCIWHIF